MADIKNLILFKFLISHLVPKGVPVSCTDTFTSHRNDPLNQKSNNYKGIKKCRFYNKEIYKPTSSMFPSEDPKVRSKVCNLRTARPASFDVLISGSVTISIKPIPERFKS